MFTVQDNSNIINLKNRWTNSHIWYKTKYLKDNLKRIICIFKDSQILKWTELVGLEKRL